MDIVRRWVIAIAALLPLWACSDDPLVPPTVVGHYRLETVDGRALPVQSPPCSGCEAETISHGDIVLRDDGSFGWGIGSSSGWLLRGTFRVRDGDLTLRIPSGEAGRPDYMVAGTVHGDSVVIALASYPAPRRHVYRRVPRQSTPVYRRLYTLAAINGRGDPLTLQDTVISGSRRLSVVLFDSLTFIDEAFYSQARAQEGFLFTADGDTLTGSDYWFIHGVYTVEADTVRLRPYGRDGTGQVNALKIVGTSLVRTTRLRTGALEERYDRRLSW